MTAPATVVIASKAGRLGNRLFLSAYFMANARSRGYRLFNPALGEYASLFEGSARDPFCRFPPHPLPLNGEELDPEFAAQCRELICGIVEWPGALAGRLGVAGTHLLDIRRSHDAPDLSLDLTAKDFEKSLHSGHTLLVKGWKFRDDANLLRFHREISAYFTPVPSVRLPAELALKRARDQRDLVIGVHIRQGDYRGWKEGAHYFETSQYVHWMHEAVALEPERKTVFLVAASDPVDWNLFQGLTVVPAPGTVAGDLHALSLCDAIMGPPSTFSTWASYHGRVPLCMLQQHTQRVRREDFVLHDRV